LGNKPFFEKILEKENGLEFDWGGLQFGFFG
jgi:hypothetical protein